MSGLEFNVRLMNKFNQSGGQWRIDPAAIDFAKRIKSAKEELALFEREEPESGWMLETSGTDSPWHKFKD